jgi:hypothetical protein
MMVAKLLIGVAWFVATIGVPIWIGGTAVNAGFVAALALAVAAAASSRRFPMRGSAARALAAPVALATLAFIVPALVRGFELRVWLSAGRGCAALVWFGLVLALHHEDREEGIARAALALLVGNFAIAVVSPLFPGHLGVLELVQHEYARGLPRFRGLAHSPAPAGVWAIASIGLTETLPQKRLRVLGRALGLLEGCASLSLALLAVPSLLATLLPYRSLRCCLGLCAALAAAFILYFQPLQLTLGSHRFELSRLHAGYSTDGLGPQYMPVTTLALHGVALSGHSTAYGKLAARGLSCFAEHPLTGVGPGRFGEACPVMAMNTFGEWSDRRDSHNQLGGPLAELGLLGMGLLCGAGLTFCSGYTLKRLTPWQRGVWVALLVCAFGSEDLLTLPVLALLATQLEPRLVPSPAENAE